MTTYCSSSSVFMTNKTPNGARKHRESTQPNSSKTAKFFFIFFLSFFRRASSILRQPLTLVHETAAFSTEQCTTPSLFHNFEASQGARSHSLKHYGFQFGTPFSLFVLTHAHLKITSQYALLSSKDSHQLQKRFSVIDTWKQLQFPCCHKGWSRSYW